MIPHLQELCGTTLDDVTVHWRNGVVLVSFLPAAQKRSPYTLRAIDFSLVEVPRTGPGARRLVSTATQQGQTVSIEMASGESLRITAARFSIDRDGE